MPLGATDISSLCSFRKHVIRENEKGKLKCVLKLI